MHYVIKTLICLLVTGLLLGCSQGRLKIFRIDIPQGNIITPEMVSQLEPGMTYNQVRFVLGTPLLVDVFHQTRWDYVYSYQPGFPALPPLDVPEEKRLKVYFVDGRLDHYEFQEKLISQVVIEPPETPEQAAGQLRLQDDTTPPPQIGSQ